MEWETEEGLRVEPDRGEGVERGRERSGVIEREIK